MDTVFSLFESLHWWHWCAGGLVLIGLETLAPGVFLLWIGLGAVVTGGIVAATGIESWEIQCLLFVLLTFISLILGRKYIHKAAPSDDTTLNRRLASYVGREADVAQPIVNGKGRIKLGDTLWIVQGQDCPAGTRVRVTGVDGSELIVAIEKSPERLDA